jgi:hypothetical protein
VRRISCLSTPPEWAPSLRIFTGGAAA